MPFTIGIDFGGVLSRHSAVQDESQPIVEHVNTAIDMPYAVETLQILKAEGHALHIISFCGKNRARESSAALTEHNLAHLFDTQNYVKNKMFKAQLCEYLGCDIMIDDRLPVLDNVKARIPGIHTIWFGSDVAHEKHVSAKTWLDVHRILKTFPEKTCEPNNSISIDHLCHYT